MASINICHDGVKLHGKGFSVTSKQFDDLGVGLRNGVEIHLRPFRNGKDINGRHPKQVADKFVIDLYSLNETDVRQSFPEIYQHLLRTVRVAREKQMNKSPTKDAISYFENWWVMGKPRPELRQALPGLSRFIGTADTAKHRIFQFLPMEYVVDDGVVVIADDQAYTLGILSSEPHLRWTFANCGLMGVASFEQGHRYFKSSTFDPFPFPDATDAQRSTIAELAEELDDARKLAIAETDKLTMTELYNLREKLRSGDPMSDKDTKRATAARAGIVNRLHEQLDQAVADAYGWGEEWRAGALGPSEIVARLVALNHERAKEEAEGHIRWLCPDYQIPRFAPKKG